MYQDCFWLVCWFLREEQFNKFTAHQRVNGDHNPLGKQLLEVCLSYFFQNSEYWNPVRHSQMNCNDLYSCRVTSYFIQGPYGSLLSGEINGTTCFTPRRGGRDQCCWNWQRHCRRWLFLMNGWMKNNQTPTVENKSHGLCQPSPQGWCFSEPCAFCECRCLVLPFTSNDPWETAPREAQLLCCRMPEPILKMLWVETGVLFTAGGLCFICLGLMKEKVIDMGSTLPFCNAFLAFRTPVSCRNCVLFGIEVYRQMWT